MEIKYFLDHFFLRLSLIFGTKWQRHNLDSQWWNTSSQKNSNYQFPATWISTTPDMSKYKRALQWLTHQPSTHTRHFPGVHSGDHLGVRSLVSFLCGAESVRVSERIGSHGNEISPANRITGNLTLSLISQLARGFHPLLVQCWATVVDGGPTLNQQWDNASCLLGSRITDTRYTECAVPMLGQRL